MYKADILTADIYKTLQLTQVRGITAYVFLIWGELSV